MACQTASVVGTSEATAEVLSNPDLVASILRGNVGPSTFAAAGSINRAWLQACRFDESVLHSVALYQAGLTDQSRAHALACLLPCSRSQATMQTLCLAPRTRDTAAAASSCTASRPLTCCSELLAWMEAWRSGYVLEPNRETDHGHSQTRTPPFKA